MIKRHRLGLRDQDHEVIEVHGSDGGPPFMIRCGDSGDAVLVGGLCDLVFELNRVPRVQWESRRSVVEGEWFSSHLGPFPAASA